ncbi:Histidine kinase [Ruminococcaceae bacterium FB2012]|nr:Histidine kinase [Ruminococcaceae bacterium FB2012]
MISVYFENNFMTLLILSAVVMLMFANKKNRIAGSELFSAGVVLLLIITVTDTLETLCAAGDPVLDLDLARRIELRKALGAANYILRPFIILIEVLILTPSGHMLRPLLAVPVVVNSAVYATAFFGSSVAFGITPSNTFFRGPLGNTIFVTQIVYVSVLLVFSVKRFKNSDWRRSSILLLIIAQVIIAALLEYGNILTGYSNSVTALVILEYYIFLTVVYQQEMREAIIQRDLKLEKDKMLMLRNQIHPHFIYNSLSIIRSLAKHDSSKAVSCIDSFSDYLKAHICAIETDSMIFFEKELYNVKAYLDLARADTSRKIEVIYRLGVKDFMLPPLSLEPIIENAVNHGLSRDGGVITICTEETEENYIVRISDNGTARRLPDNDKPFHLGVGIENTRSRLAMHCGGSLEMDMAESGTTVTVSIPKNRGKEQ